MSRKARHRAFAALVFTMGLCILGAGLNLARASTSHGADRNARAEALAVALDAYTAAVSSCDLNTAREAYEEAESVFNAVGIDIQFASPERYLFFEHVYIQDQVRSGLGLVGDVPYDCEANKQLAADQAAAWNEIITFLANSPAETPLFNDVATLRSIHQGLRRAATELAGNPAATPQTEAAAPDPAAAKEYWFEFVADYPTARPLIAFRNEALAAEIDGLVAAVTTALQGDPSTGFPNASPALAALASRYGLGIDLVTAAARNSVPSQSSQPVFADRNFSSIDFLGDIVLTIFEIRDLIATATPDAAAQVQVQYSDWLQYPLSFKTGGPLTRANAEIETAIADYVGAQTPETTRALLDALLIVEQVFVGQYWGTPELVQFYEANEQPGGTPVPATFVASLTPGVPNGVLRGQLSAQ